MTTLAGSCLRQSREAGIKCDHVLRVAHARSASSLMIARGEGESERLDDLEIQQYLDSDYLLTHEGLFERASLIVIDAALPEENPGDTVRVGGPL